MFIDVNEISGTIPSALANMKNVQSINLLANQLSGTIPTGLQSKPWAGTTDLLAQRHVEKGMVSMAKELELARLG
eukprot:COSAG05_NODE_9157_length_643_cov_1.545956_2_plen_75_part_00